MMLVILIVLVVVAAGGYYWWSKNKGVLPGAANDDGQVYKAEIAKDCTGKNKPADLNGTIEIRVHSANTVSVFASQPQKKGGGFGFGPTETSAEDLKIQTSTFFRSGCVNYTTDGDKITVDLQKSDALKWMNGGKPLDKMPNIVFSRTKEDQIKMTEPETGSVCVFSKVKGAKAGTCGKPEFGCGMM